MPFLEVAIRTSIYIDGFNFYYGCVKGTPFKWLDFHALCSAILPSSAEIVKIRYFTAMVSGTDSDPDKPNRQQVYLRALRTHIPVFEQHLGHFTRETKRLPLAADPKKWVEVIRTEEKGSDVNLAVNLVNDAWNDLYDQAVVISNDSDLAQAIRLAKSRGKKVGVFTNKTQPTKKLRTQADFYRRISRTHVRNSQLPDPIPGTTIHKPAVW